MKLTHEERIAILRGEHPRLERPYAEGEEAPFSVGQEIALKTLSSLAGPVPQVAITIIRCRRSKKGEWVAAYSVKDDRPLFVATQPGYTRNAEQSIDPEAPILDEGTEKRFVVEAKLSRANRREERETAKGVRRKRERAIRDRLRQTLEQRDIERTA
jgi:hypothetical protein